MPPDRRLFIIFVILIINYITEASVAEEINFEVSNMRESGKKDSQVQELDKTEYDQYDSNNRNESDDPEIAPSEIVETHVLPDGASPQEEVNPDMKRPRRRRRRRRRKRPKPTANPDDVANYYSAPEEEIKRKPIKYRLPETNDEIPQETSTLPRRRNIKRRRRPQKRPITDEITSTNEEISDQTNSTVDESQIQTNYDQQVENQDKINSQDLPEQVPHSPEIQKQEPETIPNTERPTLSDEAVKTQEEKVVPHDYGLHHNQKFVPDDKSKPFTNQENRFGKTLRPSESPTKHDDHLENLAPNTAFVFSKLVTQEEETTIAPKRRKRPLAKVRNATETEKHNDKLVNAETKNHNTNLRKTDSKFNVTTTVSPKTEEAFKVRDASRKEGFKIRRLPPISAILRQVKIRPLRRNETQNRIEENFNNEIVSHNETTTVTPEPRDPSRSSHSSPTNIPDEEDTDHLPSEKVIAEEENFESLIIKHTTQSSLQSTSLPPTLPSTTSSTTENTAFIYIPCNHTLNEVLRHKFNFTNDNKTSINKSNKHWNSPTNHDPVSNHKNPTYDETTDAFKSVAMEDLERLLQHVTSATLSTTSSPTSTLKYTNISRNNTQHNYDESIHSSESELLPNNQFDNVLKTRTSKPITDVPESHNREPKWYQDYTKVQRDSKERKYESVKSLATNKELILLYTSTPNPSLIYNDVDSDEYSLHIRNNTFPRKYYQESLVHRSKNYAERKKLPLAVKSAIIISGAILALAVLGFFALLLSCKIRQAKSRMKCHRELYRENFHNSEFRQSSRSTSPVVSKSNYNGRSFANNMQPNIASNRNYYLWQTLRKTFQYD